MGNLLKTELVNIIYFQHFLMEPFPGNMKAFDQLRTSCLSTFKETHKSKLKKRLCRIH